MYTIAKSTRGPISDTFLVVNAGTMLENIKAGRARFIATEEVPLVAAWGNMPFRAKTYPSKMIGYL